MRAVLTVMLCLWASSGFAKTRVYTGKTAFNLTEALVMINAAQKMAVDKTGSTLVKLSAQNLKCTSTASGADQARFALCNWTGSKKFTGVRSDSLLWKYLSDAGIGPDQGARSLVCVYHSADQASVCSIEADSFNPS